jgi:radical SAM-linked protein
MDMDVAASVDAFEVQECLNKVLPGGCRILAAKEIPLKSPSLSVIIEAVRYKVTLTGVLSEDLQRGVVEFLKLESFVWTREKRGKVIELDLRRELRALNSNGEILEMIISRGKPLEFATAITGLSLEQLAGARIEKTEVIFSESIG